MNIRHWISGLILGGTMITGALLWSGCDLTDADSTEKKITVTPDSVVLTPGKTAQFKASGGYDYEWNLLPNDGSGRLNTYHGDTVVYTCMATNIGEMPKKVVVTSTIEGGSHDDSSSNNAAPYRQSTEAEVFYPYGNPTSNTSTN
jgi:hypothetical protein